MCQNPEKFHDELEEKLVSIGDEIHSLATWLTGDGALENACADMAICMGTALIPFCEMLGQLRELNLAVKEEKLELAVMDGQLMVRTSESSSPPMNPLDN